MLLHQLQPKLRNTLDSYQNKRERCSSFVDRRNMFNTSTSHLKWLLVLFNSQYVSVPFCRSNYQTSSNANNLIQRGKLSIFSTCYSKSKVKLWILRYQIVTSCTLSLSKLTLSWNIIHFFFDLFSDYYRKFGFVLRQYPLIDDLFY